MQITDVRVRKVAKEGKLKAVVSITMDEEFVVHDIKVIEGEKGLFIAMPSKKAVDGEYRDIAHPINQEQESAFRISSLRNMKKHWQRMQQKHRWYMYRRKKGAGISCSFFECCVSEQAVSSLFKNVL